MPRKAPKLFSGTDSYEMSWLAKGPSERAEIMGLEPNFEKRIEQLLTSLQKEKETSILALMTSKGG